MTMANHSVVLVTQVWDDSTGERYEIGEDGDGLGLCELRYVRDDGEIGARFTIADDALEMVANALVAEVARRKATKG